MTSEDPTAAPARRTTRVLLSLVALLLAPFTYWWTIDVPLLRATALGVWTLFGVALFLALDAARNDRRRWVVGVAVLEGAFVLFSLWAFWFAQRVPAGHPPQRAPDFTLGDQDGRTVTLSAELARGPVLLVFFRGHW